jgi:hypothetical protein
MNGIGVNNTPARVNEIQNNSVFFSIDGIKRFINAVS